VYWVLFLASEARGVVHSIHYRIAQLLALCQGRYPDQWFYNLRYRHRLHPTVRPFDTLYAVFRLSLPIHVLSFDAKHRVIDSCTFNLVTDQLCDLFFWQCVSLYPLITALFTLVIRRTRSYFTIQLSSTFPLLLFRNTKTKTPETF
jgi:hypothetical protein